MDIAESLKSDIIRRGLSASEVARDTELPLSTVSEFLRGGRDISTAKASIIAEYLGFDLTMSQIRRKEMKTYLENIHAIEEAGYSIEDAETVAEMVANLATIEEKYGPWSEEDAEMARHLVGNLESLNQQRVNCDEETAEMVAKLAGNIQWMSDNGWEEWSEEDAEMVQSFVNNLQYIEEQGEEATEDRMAEVQSFVNNLNRKRR